MKWRKLGRIFAPDGGRDWARSYALIPTAEVLGDGRLRVYYAAVDAGMNGRVGEVILDANDPTRILHDRPDPVLDVGGLGCFDDSGVNPSALVETPLGTVLYYIGWQRCERVPYMLFAGAALREEGGRFRRLSRTPVLDRTDAEPFIRSATTIVREDDGSYRCWYVSAHAWTRVDGKQYPEYIIRSTRSADGLTWPQDSEPAIDFADPTEFGFGRPWVIRDQGIYRMWYSIRSRTEPYRLGYAESRDGNRWERQDHRMHLPRSADGWDSQMICYPCVVDAAGKRYLFYNGNSHGASGFGVAVLEQD